MNKQNEPLPPPGIFAHRPWLPAVVFFVALLLVLAAVALLLTNISNSDYRFLPDFPDRLIVFLDTAAAWLMKWIVPTAAIVMLVMPVVLLFPRRHRKTGVRMLVMALCALPLGIMLVKSIFFVGLIALATDQTSIARENLAHREEARRAGLTDCVRKAVPRLRQGRWTFGDGHYVIISRGGNPERYWLVDARYKYEPRGDFWHDRVLLADVVRWEEGGRRLSVETLDGGSYELEYATGRLAGHPGNERKEK